MHVVGEAAEKLAKKDRGNDENKNLVEANEPSCIKETLEVQNAPQRQDDAIIENQNVYENSPLMSTSNKNSSKLTNDLISPKNANSTNPKPLDEDPQTKDIVPQEQSKSSTKVHGDNLQLEKAELDDQERELREFKENYRQEEEQL